MVECGIKGILNFAPVNLKLPEGIPVRNMNLVKELDILSAFVV
jgi:NADH/NAD ratio-sensing transcriptional regulator Rex